MHDLEIVNTAFWITRLVKYWLWVIPWQLYVL